MSFVGDRYEYDLFIGYSHGAGLGDSERGKFNLPLRDWTRNVAADIVEQLEIGLESLGEGEFHAYIDKSEPSASPLEDEIKRKVQSSALMLIFVSPSYLRSEWSSKEIGWFFEKAEEEGRPGLNHCAIRLAQDTPNPPALQWPAQLLDSAGNRVTFGEPFYNDATNVPIELNFRPGEFRELAPKITALVAEIRDKWLKLKAQLEAARALEPPPSPARGAPPIIYLQGYDDPEKWNSARDALAGVATVFPDQFEAFPSNLAQMKPFRERRQMDLTSCNGLVLLRGKAADPVRQLAASSQVDLGEVQEALKRSVPLVLVDLAGGDGASLPNLGIPTVVASGDDWPAKALQAIGL